jgi:hypothetical protein
MAMSFFKTGLFRFPNRSQLVGRSLGVHRICIAANPCFGATSEQHRWLVTDNGMTRPASEVVVNAGFDPSTESQGYEHTAVYVCRGTVSWKGSVAEIN